MIETSQHGSVTLLRMNHGKVNALDLEFLLELDRVLRSEERESSRALVLTGQDKAFSAGVDLHGIQNGGTEYTDRFIPALIQTIKTLCLLKKPVVAAVNSHAIAGGAILALACDYRIMATERAKFGLSELKVGVAYPSFILEMVRQAAPGTCVQELVYLAELWPATKALQKGFLHEALPQHEVLPRALQVADQLGKILPRAFQHAKAQLKNPILEWEKQFGLDADREMIAIWKSSETKAQIESFLKDTIGRSGN